MPIFRKKIEKSISQQKTPSLNKAYDSLKADLIKAENIFDPDYKVRTESRLTMSLASIFYNHEMLPHFIQFMETLDGHNLVKFYLELESFSKALQVPRKNGSTALIDKYSPITISSSKTQEEDALHLYNKYLKTDSYLSFCLPQELRDEILGKINNKVVDPNIFIEIQSWILKRIEKEYLPLYLQGSYHSKYQLNILTSGTVYLADILFNDSILFYFMEFMDQEKGSHLVDFLLMANNYQLHLQQNPETNIAQALEDAIVIYDKFFSLQASSPLGLSDNLRLELELNICPEDEKPSPTCFSKPAKIVMQFLEKAYLPQFLQNQLYFNYLSELITSSQNGSLPFRKRSGSESSNSELNFPCHTSNTLLAMESKKLVKVKDPHYMRIDTDKFSPESLWKRNLAGKLQLTTIDQFGRVKSEFQPEPDRKSTSSLLSKAVKKLVTRDDADKNQEEMAWQVAKVIVEDICNVTMGNQETSSS